MIGFKKSQQGGLDEALKKLEAGDVRSSMEALYKLATEDYPEAEHWLGHINEFLLENLSEAARWYRRAAEHGHPKSQLCFANLCITGRGIEYNPQEANRWYQIAAENNIPEAQFSLAEHYREGFYVGKNANTAFYWYQQAIKAGFEPAKARIQQFWQDGTFQDRRDDEKTPDTHHAAEPNPSRNAEMSPLFQKIVEVAQQHEYIPKEEFLLVPELRPYQEKIVDFICTYISKDMKAAGLDEEQMLGVFKFVFGRGWDSVYQWHKRPAGKIENVVTVGGNLLRGDVFLQLPDDIRYAINKSDAPRIIYGIMASWWEENQKDLRSKGIDIWSPLTVALSTTFGVAVSMALKTFGYGK